MARLEIFLLGMPQIKVDGVGFTDLVSRKARALLFYLALTKQQHARQALAGLFWGEMSESNARRNLRVTLTKLKAELGEFLWVRRRTLAINPDADIWLDVAEFEKCLALTQPTLAQLQLAADLYGGHFLDGFYLRDAPMFEDWIRPLQERYRQMAMETLYRLAVYHTQQKQYGAGIDYAGRLLTLEPWMEEAHRQMMLLQALSGQRSAALAQYETCRVMLANELGVDPVDATTTLYTQILNEEIGGDSELSSIPNPEPKAASPFQAPAQSPHFVGRLTLLENLATAFTSVKPQQMHALVGMGGIGKSTVAVQLAHLVRNSFTDGVLWAQAATAEPMAILESWAQAYGYDFSRIGDVESMAAAFRGVLADKSVLIVFDDVRSMARIRPLLPNGPQNQVLITTRNQDLARSLHAQVWPLQELLPENGRLLLTSILGESRTGDEPEAATEICELLENHPLAVEITAQRLKSRPRRRLTDMANRLRDEKQRLTLLTISDREVRASFAVSWQALDAAHRRIFALLGLFNGRSFTAAAIAHIAELDQYTTEDRLFALTALSLIREENQTRYRQHPLLADFAREQLGDDVGWGSSFANYYLQFAQQHQHNYDALRPEWGNMMAAMETAYNYQLWHIVTDFADALHNAWFTRGRFTAARSGLMMAYNASLTLGDLRKQAKTLYQWGLACLEQKDFAQSEQHLTESHKSYLILDNPNGIAETQCALTRLDCEQSNFVQAQKRIIGLKKYLDGNLVDLLIQVEALYTEARVYYFQGKYQESLQLSLNVLNFTDQKDERHLMTIILAMRLIGNSALELNDLETAEIYCLQAMELSNKINDKNENAMVLTTLSHIYRRRNDHEKAQFYVEKSLDLLYSIGDFGAIASALYLLSMVYEGQGQIDLALEVGYKSLKQSQTVGYKLLEGYIYIHLGDLHIHKNQQKTAHQHWKKALAIAKALNHKTLKSDSHKRLKA